MRRVTIRPTRPDELPVVVGLVAEAAGWLRSRGIDQWQYPPHVDRIECGIAGGEVFLVHHGGQAVATITVDSRADPEFWTDGDDPGDALYVHRMAVTRSAAGQELGAALLDWAGQRAAQSGHHWLRLDAWWSNPGLHRYYADRGFEHVRTLMPTHRGSGALFQRPASKALGIGPEVDTLTPCPNE